MEKPSAVEQTALLRLRKLALSGGLCRQGRSQLEFQGYWGSTVTVLLATEKQ